MKLHVATGGEATLLQADGERATLLTTQPFPPGTPLTLRSENGAQLQFKVNRCQKLGDEKSYRIQGRWVSLSRADRAWLDHGMISIENQNVIRLTAQNLFRTSHGMGRT